MFEYIKKMSTRKKIILGFIIIFVDAILIISYCVFKDATSLNNYNHEIDELKKMDVATDNFDRKIKSSGKYAVVEKAIKDYMIDYSNSLDETLSVINDTRLMGVLSYNNYEKDGPEFKNSIDYLNTTHEKFNKNIDNLLTSMEEENIKAYIRNKTSDNYQISLFEDFMFDDNIVDQFNKNEELLNTSKIKVNTVIETSLNVLNFLSLYKDSWVIENGEIKFKTNELFNYYNTMISKLKV